MRATTVVIQAEKFAGSSGGRAAQPQPRFLHGVFGFGLRTEHAVRYAQQARALRLKTLGEVLLTVHISLTGPVRHM